MVPKQACRRPEPSSATLACMLGALLHSTLSLDALFEAASLGAPPAAASARVHAHLGGALMRACAATTRAVADQYRAAAPLAQQVHAHVLSSFGCRRAQAMCCLWRGEL